MSPRDEGQPKTSPPDDGLRTTSPGDDPQPKASWSAEGLLAASGVLADPGRMVRLAQRWPDEDALLGAPAEDVASALGLDAAGAAQLAASVASAQASDVVSLARRGIRLVGQADAHYPPLLARIPSPPPLLFVRGDPSVLAAPCVAVVGSRRCTAYGKAVAQAVGAAAAGAGLVVVSGGALGIDGAAHEGALAGGSTIAVMGCGVDQLYPPSHRGLLERVIASGCVVSEFALGAEPLPYHFPQRNRVIAGIAERVVVVEAAMKSGARHTVDFALDFGREVVAVPGPIWAPQSAGCLRLIADGATCLADPRDIAGLFGLVAPSGSSPALCDRERVVVAAVGDGHVQFDSLQDVTGMSTPELLAALSSLELAGAVRRDAGGRVFMVAPTSRPADRCAQTESGGGVGLSAKDIF